MSNNPNDKIRAAIARLENALNDAQGIEERLNLSLQLANALTRTDLTRAETLAREVYRLAEAKELPHWIVRACIILGRLLANRSNYAQAEGYLKQAIALLEELPGYYSEWSKVYSIYGLVLAQYRGDTPGSLRMYRKAIVYGEKAGNHFEQARTLCYLAEGFHNLSMYELAAKELFKARQILKVHPNDDLHARSDLQLGRLLSAFDQWEEAILKFRESVKGYQKSNSLNNEAIGLQSIGHVLLKQAKKSCRNQLIVESVEMFYKAEQLLEPSGHRLFHASILLSLAMAHTALKEYKSAEKLYDRAYCTMKKVGNIVGCCMVNTMKAQQLLELKQWENAITLLNDTEQTYMQISIEPKPIVYEGLAQAYEMVGNVSESLAYHKKHVAASQSSITLIVDRKLLEIEFLDRQDGDDSQEVSYEEVEKELGISPDLQHDHAEELHEQGRLLEEIRQRLATLGQTTVSDREVVRELSQSIGTYHEQVDLFAEIESRVRQLMPGVVQRLRERYPSLTPSELRICMMVRMNLSNKEIASLLNISDRTVNSHRTNIRKKMGLKKKEPLVNILSAI